MKRHHRVRVVLVLAMAGCWLMPSLASAQSVCIFPTAAPDINNPAQLAQTAWQIFVAAHCPTNSRRPYPYFVWQTWQEQSEVYPWVRTLAFRAGASKPAQRFHAGPLARALAKRKTKAIPSASTGGAIPCPDYGMTISEEVRINPEAVHTIEVPWPGYSLTTRKAQAAYATGPPPPSPWFLPGPNIQFLPDAIAFQVAWVELPAPCPSSLEESVWTETYDNTCYALAGLHMIAKVLPNWIFATWEPQNMTTNPNRCVVLGCDDPFGSSPAQTPASSPGTTTQITPALKTMMTKAFMSPVFQNYRLNGVQVKFTHPNGSPTLLGNSIIDCANAGIPLTRASCITCHFASGIKANGTDNIVNLPPGPQSPIGNPQPLPPGFAPRDFVWSLMCANPGGDCDWGGPDQASASEESQELSSRYRSGLLPSTDPLVIQRLPSPAATGRRFAAPPGQ